MNLLTSLLEEKEALTRQEKNDRSIEKGKGNRAGGGGRKMADPNANGGGKGGFCSRKRKGTHLCAFVKRRTHSQDKREKKPAVYVMSFGEGEGSHFPIHWSFEKTRTSREREGKQSSG